MTMRLNKKISNMVSTFKNNIQNKWRFARPLFVEEICYLYKTLQKAVKEKAKKFAVYIKKVINALVSEVIYNLIVYILVL